MVKLASCAQAKGLCARIPSVGQLFILEAQCQFCVTVDELFFFPIFLLTNDGLHSTPTETSIYWAGKPMYWGWEADIMG